MRPLIGITTSELRTPQRAHPLPQSEPPGQELALGRTYPLAIADAGGVPVVIPPYTDETIPSLVDRLDALVLSGGPDIHPSLYGQDPHPHLGPTDPALDTAEIRLCRAALERDLPVLGICRGHELLNVALGGTLVQDLPGHRQTEPGRVPVHGVRVEGGTLLARVLGATDIEVNSFHHQAVDRLGDGLRVVAWADDGLVEGAELPGARWAVSVQWHAEALIDAPEQQRLFEELVAAARETPLRQAA